MLNPYEKLLGRELSPDEIAAFSARFVSFVQLLIEIDRDIAADSILHNDQKNGNK